MSCSENEPSWSFCYTCMSTSNVYVTHYMFYYYSMSWVFLVSSVYVTHFMYYSTCMCTSGMHMEHYVRVNAWMLRIHTWDAGRDRITKALTNPWSLPSATGWNFAQCTCPLSVPWAVWKRPFSHYQLFCGNWVQGSCRCPFHTLGLSVKSSQSVRLPGSGNW